ncbi:hypothetical protein B6D60_09180, partial [candidate division KSB1 bacterium 4484_87]
QAIWKDGSPAFTHIDTMKNVKVGQSITLEPLSGSSSQPAGFQVSLSGEDWNWPDKIPIEAAEDIDARTFLGSYLYLVTDAAGKRVLEINPATGSLIWEFSGENVNDPRYLAFPVDAFSYSEKENEETVRKVLITDQGRHRVIKVIQATKDIQWSFGHADVEGTADGYLSSPSDAVAIPDSGKVFICDKGNNRILLVRESDGAVEWRYNNGLNNPVDIEYNEDQNAILVTDQSNHRVILIDLDTNAISWQFGKTAEPDSGSKGLNLPSDADFLSNGNILIADAGNHRLIEVNPAGDVVWEFGKRFENLKDADRLNDNKHVIVNENLPARIGYTTDYFVSSPFDIGKEVSFTNLLWEADTMAGISSVKLQLRSANTLGDLESAHWYGPGPTEDDTLYVSPFTQINPVHNGHRFYQFKARLITSNPLYTPTLNNVILNYFYYDVEATGIITSDPIYETGNRIITRWNKLFFNTILPTNPANRNKVELKITIKDAITKADIRSFTASNVDTTNEEALSSIVGLQEKQSIYLQASFKTNNSSVSPALDFWELEWESTTSSLASIQFVNEDYLDVSRYRFSDKIQPGQAYIDRITIQLTDSNLVHVRESIDVDIQALLSTDRETVTLKQQANGSFLLQPSIPGIILKSGGPIRDNGFLEVVDRDTLIVTYIDPTNPSDIAMDSVLIIENTLGSIFFTNRYTMKIDTISENDTVFVYVRDELDQDISVNQDTLFLDLINSSTNDREMVTLLEIADSTGAFRTGDFFSSVGYPIQLKNVGIIDDRKIQVIGNDRIIIDYDDSASPAPSLYVMTGTAPPEDISNKSSSPLDFDIAPNPYKPNSGYNLQFRVSSSIGKLEIEKIEIFSMAGEKITEIPEAALSMFYNYPIPPLEYGFSKNWWDLKNSSGEEVSSGTYFIKISCRFSDTNKRISKIRKLVVIR